MVMSSRSPGQRPTKAYDVWHTLARDLPPPDVEPSSEQLGAMNTVFVDGGPPDADFAIWGNSDYMKSRRPKLRGLRPGGDGLWYTVQLSARENITVWNQCFELYRTVVIMHEIYLLP